MTMIRLFTAAGLVVASLATAPFVASSAAASGVSSADPTHALSTSTVEREPSSGGGRGRGKGGGRHGGEGPGHP